MALVLVLALIARCAVALRYQNIDPETANLWEYGAIARNTIAYGKMLYEVRLPDGSLFLYPTAYMPPLMDFMWVGLFWVFGVSKAALAAMTVINIFMGTAIVYLSMRIASRIFLSDGVGLVAGMILAVHPVFVFAAAATYHAVSLYVVLLLAVFDIMILSPELSLRGWLLCGFLSGLAILARTEYLVLTAAVGLGALLKHRRPAHAIAAALCALAVVAPWTARNYFVLHHFVLVANSAGYNLYKAFNPEANGSGHWMDVHRVARRLLAPELDQVPLTADFETATDGVYRSAAEAFMRTHPLASYAWLPLRKVLLFWLYDYHDEQTRTLWYQAQFWPLLLLTTAGVAWAWRSGKFEKVEHQAILILWAAETLLMMYYAVHARYRMNVEPFLYAYASYGAVTAAHRLRRWWTADTVRLDGL